MFENNAYDYNSVLVENLNRHNHKGFVHYASQEGYNYEFRRLSFSVYANSKVIVMSCPLGLPTSIIYKNALRGSHYPLSSSYDNSICVADCDEFLA